MATGATQTTTPARERILTAADELFYRYGLRGVGVDRVITKSGVAKATLYHHFPSKDQLAAEYVRRRDRAWTGKLRQAAEAAGPAPADQLQGLFDAIDALYRSDSFHGCAFIQAMMESEPGSPQHAAAVAHKRAIRAWLRDLATTAGASDPDILAYQLTTLIDGALVAARMAKDSAVPVATAAAARALLADALNGAR